MHSIPLGLPVALLWVWAIYLSYHVGARHAALVRKPRIPLRSNLPAYAVIGAAMATTIAMGIPAAHDSFLSWDQVTFPLGAALCYAGCQAGKRFG